MSSKASLRVLVVGGAGYIGSHVTKALVQKGHQPVVFDNLSSGLRQNLRPDVPFIHGDILLSDQVNRAFEGGIDAVIHLAALKAAGESMEHPERYAVHNLTGSINLMNAAVAAKVDRFVFSSSAAVYGEPTYLPMDEAHPLNPINFYGFTKLEIENLLSWYDQIKGMRYASLRYFNAAGYDVDGELKGLEQNPQNLLPVVMEAAMGMRPHVVVFGNDYQTQDGSCIRDYIHVTDLAEAHVLALDYLTAKNKSLVVNLGTANGLSVFEVIETAKKLTGVDFTVKVGPRRPGDPEKMMADVTKAYQLLGWKAKHSEAEPLVASMVDAYRANVGR